MSARTVRVPAAVALVAVASAAIAFITLELLPTGVSSVRDATSRWALTPYFWGFRWFEVSLAVSGIALAAALARSLPRHRVGVLVAFALFAIGRLLVGWVNEDAPGAPATVRGDVHWALGVVSFVSSIVAMLLTARALRRSGRPGPLAAFSVVMGSISAIAILLLFGAAVTTALSAAFGVFERGYYITTMIWIGVLAVRSALTT